jgi:hypothetical protein
LACRFTIQSPWEVGFTPLSEVVQGHHHFTPCPCPSPNSKSAQASASLAHVSASPASYIRRRVERHSCVLWKPIAGLEVLSRMSDENSVIVFVEMEALDICRTAPRSDSPYSRSIGARQLIQGIRASPGKSAHLGKKRDQLDRDDCCRRVFAALLWR